jgi:hypothetical protein
VQPNVARARQLKRKSCITRGARCEPGTTKHPAQALRAIRASLCAAKTLATAVVFARTRHLHGSRLLKPRDIGQVCPLKLKSAKPAGLQSASCHSEHSRRHTNSTARRHQTLTAPVAWNRAWKLRSVLTSITSAEESFRRCRPTHDAFLYESVCDLCHLCSSALPPHYARF